MPIFNIVNAENNEVYLNALGRPYQCNSAADAQDMINGLKLAQPNGKWRMKQVEDNAWADREYHRLYVNGTYTRLPFHAREERWWMAAKSVWGKHYPHVSTKVPGSVAYTPNAKDGMADKQVPIKLGRYLDKYLKSHLETYGIDVRVVIAEFDRLYKPKKLHFAATEDEIEHVYVKGPPSCMSSVAYRKNNGWGVIVGDRATGKFPDISHACRVYAFGDLQVAYLLEDDDKPDSVIIARSLVWPEKKAHSRIYGDVARLRAALNAEGYDFGSLEGAKIQRIVHAPFKPYDGRPDYKSSLVFVSPYIDFGKKSGEGCYYLHDKGDHLVLVPKDKGGYIAGMTLGVTKGYVPTREERLKANGVKCQCGCNERFLPEEMLGEVYLNDEDHTVSQQWSLQHANEKGAFQSYFDGLWYGPDVEKEEGVGGLYWTKKQWDSYGFICKRTLERSDMRRAIRMANGDLWSRDAFTGYGFTSRGNGKNYPNEELVTVNHQRWAKSELEAAKANGRKFHASRCCGTIDALMARSCGCDEAKRVLKLLGEDDKELPLEHPPAARKKRAPATSRDFSGALYETLSSSLEAAPRRRGV